VIVSKYLMSAVFYSWNDIYLFQIWNAL